jgi:ParB/RepB/Spo0J family partition protein
MNDLDKNESDERGRRIDMVKIDEIVLNPDHPRKFIDDDILRAYAESIKIVGILQPILVQKDEDDKIHLVVGETRVRAAKMAGKKNIPAIFLNPKAKANFLVLFLIENIHKTPLTPLEEGEALYQLRSKFRFSDRELNLITGKSKKEINELIEFNNLPDNVKEYCRRTDPKKVTKRKLQQIAKIEEIETFDGFALYPLFHSRPQRARVEIAQDRAKSLNKTLNEIVKKGHQGCDCQGIKTELKKINMRVWRALER